MGALEAKYGITIERFKPDPGRLELMLKNHGEYLFFDSREKQEYCCSVRKVEPNRRALATVDVWITGLRRDQSRSRTSTPKAAEVHQDGRSLVKLCPLIDWTEKQVADYISQYEVPYNRLYDQGFTSIGCIICSTPTLPGEDKRAGRWRWWNHPTVTRTRNAEFTSAAAASDFAEPVSNRRKAVRRKCIDRNHGSSLAFGGNHGSDDNPAREIEHEEFDHDPLHNLRRIPGAACRSA